MINAWELFNVLKEYDYEQLKYIYTITKPNFRMNIMGLINMRIYNYLKI